MNRYCEYFVMSLRLFDWSFRASRPYDDIICVAQFLFDWEYFAILQTSVLYEDYEDQSTLMSQGVNSVTVRGDSL